jgi:hypothetical protein
MSKTATLEITPITEFDEVLDIWIEKPNTILKCITCASFSKRNEKDFRSLHPKSKNKRIVEEEIIRSQNKVVIKSVENNISYEIELKKKILELTYKSDESSDHPAHKFDWLKDILLPKIAKFLSEVFFMQKILDSKKMIWQSGGTNVSLFQGHFSPN